MKREKPNYSGSFGYGDDAFTPTSVKTFITKQERYQGADASQGNNEVLLKETVDTVNASGQVEHRLQTEHFYSADFAPVGSIEREWIYTNVPGTPSKDLWLVKIKHTDQEYYIAPLKLAMTTEMVEELVIVDRVRQGSGLSIYDNPNPAQYIKRLDRTRSYIDKSKKTNQEMLWMTTHYSKTLIDRTGPDTLLKRKIDYDVISGTGKMDSQILQNPKPEQKRSNGEQFRREYFNGTPVRIGNYDCYKKSVTISHQDITTDEIAEALAERAFYRRNVDVKEATVKTSLPIPIGTLPVKVILKPIPRDVTVSGVDAESQLLYPSGSSGADDTEYFLKSVTERFAQSDDGEPKIEQTLSLATTL